MNRLDEKIVAAVFVLIGGVAGFLVFTFGFGGWEFVFTGKSSSVFFGFPGLLLCIVSGGCWGAYSYKHRHREVVDLEPFAKDAAGGFLMSKRFSVVLVGLIALYCVWHFTRGLR